MSKRSKCRFFDNTGLKILEKCMSKRSKCRFFDNTGLCLSGGAMVYGVNHGVLRWAPMWIKRFICHVWNSSRCLIKGHDPLSYEMYIKHVIPGFPVCVNCCARLKIDGKYPTDSEVKAHNDLCDQGWKEAEEKWRTEHPEEYQRHLEETKKFEEEFPYTLDDVFDED